MTWKEAVRDELIRYQRQTASNELTLPEFYDFAEDALEAQYPDNNHVRAKIRQVLQQLRDAGEVEFVNNQGNYRLSSTDDSTTSSHESSASTDDSTTSSHESIDAELEGIRIMTDIGTDTNNK